MKISTQPKPENSRDECGAVSVRAIVIIAVIAIIAAALFWPESQVPSQPTAPFDEPKTEAHDDSNVKLYTCGMHPQVLSDKPGTCPICQMDLTPVKMEGAAAGKSAAKGERKVKYWRAPMDPNYVSDKPGKSPMGMDLVPVYEEETADEGGMAVTISPVVVQNMGVRTARVGKKPLVRTVRTVGTIDYDETLVRDVNTKFDGWIEELYADYTGQQIEQGMPLFSVYSRELYSSQEEYLLALRNKDSVYAEALPEASADMQQLVESTRLRLKLFDVSNEEIEAIERRGAPAKTLTILSPHTGIIVEKTAREGMHITPGTKLYTIADLSRVWVYVDIYENEVPFVKIGQEAIMELSYLPNQTFHGKVIYIYPFVDTTTRTVKVRLEFDNPHLHLKPGMFADVSISADLGRESVIVPRAAVIDTGERQVAFVALGGGRFEPREISAGLDAGEDDIEILGGLREGELVVTSGQFLLDSESKLREAVLKMMAQKQGSVDTSVASAPVKKAHDMTGDNGQPHEAANETARPGSAGELASAARPFIESYLELQRTLSRDGHDRLEQAVEALEEPIDRLASAAEAGGDSTRAVRERTIQARDAVARMRGRSLETVRAQFSGLSRHVIEIVEIIGVGAFDTALNAFHCPMAGSSWLQQGEEPANPYYGFSMLRCGDAIELATGEAPSMTEDAGTHEGHRGSESGGRAPPGSAAEIGQTMRPVIQRYLKLQEALSRDQQQGLEGTVKALDGTLAELRANARKHEGRAWRDASSEIDGARGAIAKMTDASLEGVRGHFGDLSRRIIELLNLVGPANIDGDLRAFHCPMAGGRWVQKGDQAANPYFGPSMLKCGEAIDIAKPFGEDGP